MERILTVPREEKEYIKYLATGNDYISIPSITEKGEIEAVNIILDSTRSLLDFRGGYLIEPFIAVESQNINLEFQKSGYEKCWIPVFEFEDTKISSCIKIISPKGYKGFVYGITIKNTTNAALKIKCGVSGSWDESTATVFHTKKLDCIKDIFMHQWTNSIILEIRGAATLAALGVSGENGSSLKFNRENMSYEISNEILLSPSEEKTLYYYYSVNLEQDGAGTTNIDLRRRGGDKLYLEESKWLTNHIINLENTILSEKVNRNLFFAYFYSIGYTLDTEEQVLLTSRSHKYYVSAAFWGRDSLLWSFPAIMMVDKDEASKVLMTCFTRYLKNAGIHSLYINGSVLYPGFELDELAAYVVALDEYIEWTGDTKIMNTNEIGRGLLYILKELKKWYSPEYGLYKTELDPSDDPVTYEYLIYDNVLVFRALSFLSKHGYVNIEDVDRLKASIEKYGIIEGPFGKMFAWATDCKNNHEIYDDPPGSLTLIAYYGFCHRDDEVYKNTLKWIYSPNNEYYYKTEQFETTGCLHTPFPWLMGICNYLLVFRDEERIKMIEKLELDNGFACESFDGNTGILKTGGAFATCAGFFGYTMMKTLKKPIE